MARCGGMAFWTPLLSSIILLLNCHGPLACSTEEVTLNVVLFSGEGPSRMGFEETFAKYRDKNHPLPTCVQITVNSVDVHTHLQLPEKGWTNIQPELIRQSRTNQVETHIVVGPYYMNVAMMLEQLNVTYLTTAGKGYHWSDMTRVEDTVNWATLVELVPPQEQQNMAVVDLFLVRHWRDAIMIMPDRLDRAECSDLAHQMTDDRISLIPFSIPYNSSNTKKFIKIVLRHAELMAERQIVICSPRDHEDHLIFAVLQQAKKFNMLEKEDYTFVIVEPYSLLSALAGLDNNVNLGLFNAKCEILSFQFIHPQREIMDPHYAMAADTAVVIGKAMQGYFDEAGPKASNEDFTSLRLLHQIKKLSGVYGETGHLKFNKRGGRSDYKLHLYQYGGAKVFKKIGEWTSTGKEDRRPRIKFTQGEDDEAVELEDMGIFPDIVKVVVVVDAPFVMRKKDGTGRNYGGENEFVGFSIDLLDQLSRELLFSYEVYQAPNNSYGLKGENGTWDGMVGEILAGVNKRAMLALGALSITSSREEVIDFTHGILTTGSNILVPKPQRTLSIFQFLKPFSPTLWYALLTAFFLLCGMFYLLDSQSDTQATRVFTPKECLWFCLGVLLMRGTDFSPKSTPQRILTTGYIFFALISVSTYTANMAAFLTTANLNPEVSTFEDLLQSDELVPLVVDHTSTMSYIRDSKEELFKGIWRKISKHDGIVTTAEEGATRVASGGHALIFDYRINAFAEQTLCKTMAVGLPVLRLEHGIGLPAGNTSKRLLDMAILRLRESGHINTLIKKWWTERRQCDKTGDPKSSNEAHFKIDHMAGIFIVGGSGLCLSVAFFTVKKLYLRKMGNPQEEDAATPKDTDRNVTLSESRANAHTNRIVFGMGGDKFGQEAAEL